MTRFVLAQTMWHNSLKYGPRALLDKVKPQVGGVIVRRRKQLEGRVLELFAYFDTAESLLEEIKKRSPEERDMHEIVLEDEYQKPRFDIDIAKEVKGAKELGVRLINELAKVCQTLLAGIETGWQVYISEGSFGSGDFSAHIVLTKLLHKTSQEARSFYDLIKAYLSPDVAPYLDVMVYGKIQNFRLLYCRSLSHDNTKWLAGSPREYSIKDFKASLLSNQEGCRVLVRRS